MAQHVEVDGKWNAGPLADDLDQPVDGVRRERRAALGGEDHSRCRDIPSAAPAFFSWFR